MFVKCLIKKISQKNYLNFKIHIFMMKDKLRRENEKKERVRREIFWKYFREKHILEYIARKSMNN